MKIHPPVRHEQSPTCVTTISGPQCSISRFILENIGKPTTKKVQLSVICINIYTLTSHTI